MGNVFERQRLTGSQMLAVAERRYGDAVALCDTGHVERAPGAMYMAGFVLEILLKAQLIKTAPSLGRTDKSAESSVVFRRRWQLIHRSHDLTGLLDELSDLRSAIGKASERASLPYDQWLASICATWSIFARYSSRVVSMQEARQMVDRVRYLKELLK